MLREHSRSVDTGLRLFDLSVLTLALPFAYYLREWLLGDRSPAVMGVQGYWPLLTLTLLFWIGGSWLLKVYDVYRTRPVSTELGRLARAMAVVAVFIFALGFLSKQHQMSRLFIGLYFSLSLAMLVLNRIVVRSAARTLRRRGYNSRMYAVVGSGDLAQDVVENISAHPEWGYVLAGYVLDGDGAAPSADRTVLGRLADMGDILENHVLDEVIFAVPRDRLAATEQAVRLCEEQGVSVRISLEIFRGGVARMEVSEMDGLPMLAFTRTPSDTVQLVAKRIFDVAVSGLVLLLLSPALLAAALAIKLDSPGPVFFRQRRVGLNGRAFTILKFRSMYQDAEARLEALQRFNEMSGPVFKMTNDPRVTRVGGFLRRTSLDEFPQFWNVLRGEMSVVGPRPPLPSEVRKYKRWQRRRLSVKPGITCTWQVSGRNDIDFEQWMELDLEYIDHWSLWMDFQICLKTIPAVLSARGAH